MYRHKQNTVIGEIHQDDGHFAGTQQDLTWLRDKLADELALKCSRPLGPGDTYEYLKVIRHRTPEGTCLQTHPKHTDRI